MENASLLWESGAEISTRNASRIFCRRASRGCFHCKFPPLVSIQGPPMHGWWPKADGSREGLMRRPRSLQGGQGARYRGVELLPASPRGARRRG
jgi:hypothetical protein